jgi:hypothetical protein
VLKLKNLPKTGFKKQFFFHFQSFQMLLSVTILLWRLFCYRFCVNLMIIGAVGSSKIIYTATIHIQQQPTTNHSTVRHSHPLQLCSKPILKPYSILQNEDRFQT